VAPPVVAVGASAGGIEALRGFLPLLQPDWGLAFAIVLHRHAVEEDDRLEMLLNGWSSLAVRKPRDGEVVTAGVAVVAPADVHLILEDGRYRLSTGPRENHARPSVDVLFRSVAEHYGRRGAGVVLSGLLDDGAAGVADLRRHGALTIAQDPSEAVHSGMPRSAIAAGAQIVARVAEIPKFLRAFAKDGATLSVADGPPTEKTRLTRFTCPDCGGVLAEEQRGDFLHYRCRVGHAFSMQILHERKGEEIEEAIWSAIQILEEQVDLSERIVHRALSGGNESLGRRMEARARRYRERAEMLRRALATPDEAIETTEARDAIS
jgi:two-component system, chemotaxis family, protein-glutamate methylesterase/glutaminase